jgi:hypothetical protein
LGSNLLFTLDYGGWPGPITGADVLGYPQDLPTITKISGCTDVVNTTTACSTNGGTYVTLYGVNFLVPVTVMISGDPCAPTRNLSPTRVECPIPSGTGYEQSVVVTSVFFFFSFPISTPLSDPNQ